jgi:anti-anti-sigma regulatory factor
MSTAIAPHAFPNGNGSDHLSGDFVETLMATDFRRCNIELRREMDASGPRSLRTMIMSALGKGERHVIVDCFGWEKLDLLVLSTLVQGAKACAAFGASFELVNLEGHVRDDIVALRLERRLGLAA